MLVFKECLCIFMISSVSMLLTQFLFYFIGKGGSKIRELQDHSGARIKVGTVVF